jgi:AraC family transcriptional regulator
VEATSRSQLEPPRFENGRLMLVAGLRERFTGASMRKIPELWQRFGPSIGNIPGQIGQVAYGLCSNMLPQPFSFDYMAGVEVSSSANLPAGFSHVSIPELRYSIFPHREHLSKLPNTIDAIFNHWLPNSGYALLHGVPDLPYMMERYGGSFDPQTGFGDLELWISLTAK